MDYFPRKITVNEATSKQQLLSEEVVLRDELPADLNKVAGAVTMSSGDNTTASIAVLDFPDLNKLKEVTSTKKANFPEIATFEGFRDGRVVVDLISSLKEKPDLLMIKGHGINHPRRFGLACHVGLALDMPTIGVCNGLLCGRTVSMEGKDMIMDDADVLGRVVKHHPGSPSLYVSPGYKVTIDTAAMVVKKCLKSAWPEPIKFAQGSLLKELKL